MKVGLALEDSWSEHRGLFGLGSWFGVQIGGEVVCGHAGGDAVGGHFDFADPKQSVEDGFTEVFITPVFVEMPAGKAEAASAIRPLHRPHGSFGCAFFRLDVGVGAFGVNVGAVAGGIWRRGDEDGHELHAGIFSGYDAVFESRAEAHVDVPFIRDLKGLHALGDGMGREAFEFGFPDRIAGKAVFIMPAEPFFKLRTAELGHDFHAVVHDAKTDAFTDEATQGRQMIFLHGGMAFAAISIDDHGIGIDEGGFIFDPAHFVAIHHQVRDLAEAFLQQGGTGFELMHSRWVGGLASDEYELVFAIRRHGLSGETEEAEGGKKETHKRGKGRA